MHDRAQKMITALVAAGVTQASLTFEDGERWDFVLSDDAFSLAREGCTPTFYDRAGLKEA